MSHTRESSGEAGMPEYTLDDYWTALYRRKLLILLIAAVSIGVAGGISSILPELYEASVVFYVPSDVDTSLGTGAHLMRARLPSGLQDHARAYAAILKHADAWTAVQKKYPQKPLWQFGRDIDIQATREGLIRIYCRDADPELAANIANAMVDNFNDLQRNLIRSQLELSQEALDVQIKDAEQQILEASLRRQDFMEEFGIASMPTNLSQLEDERLEFNHRLLDVQVERASIESQIESLGQQMEQEATRYVRGQLLETKEGKFYALLRERKSLLEVDLAGVRAEVTGLRLAIAVIDQTIRKQPAVVVRLQVINDEISAYRQVRAQLEVARDGLRTGSAELRSVALVIRKATPPRTAVFPKTKLNMVLAGMAGLLVGVVYVLLLGAHEGRRRRRSLTNLEREVRTASRAERSSGSAG